MGFSDFFKDSVNWTLDELVALYKLLIAQGGSDGEFTEEEAEVTAIILEELRGSDITSSQSLIERASNMSAEDSLSILKRMHSDKRTATVGYMILVGAADGDFDDNEIAFSALIAQALGVA